MTPDEEWNTPSFSPRQVSRISLVILVGGIFIGTVITLVIGLTQGCFR